MKKGLFGSNCMAVNRITSIDILRWWLLIGMMLFHLNFLLRDVFSLPFLYNHGVFEEVAQMTIGSWFLILAGFCSQYFQAGQRRNILLWIASMSVSGITLWFIPQFPVQFWILHCFFLLAMIDTLPQISRIQWQIPIFIFLLISSFFFPIQWWESSLWIPFGIIPEQFYSIDYYPVIPWAVCYFFWKLLAQSNWFPRMLLQMSHMHFPVLEWLWKNSLLIYCIHIPLLYFFVLCASILI
jgi:uncharacterized membrane protein